MSSGMKRTEYGYVCSTERYIIEKLSREDNHMQAIIYTKPNCPKCRMTVNLLSKAMPVQTIKADERDYKRFRDIGYQSMPVVTVYKAYGAHDEWCDFRVDKIKQYTEK
jgi:glutaredoxin-like protein NrdH